MVVGWTTVAMVLVVCKDDDARRRVTQALERRLKGVRVVGVAGATQAWNHLGSALVEMVVVDDCVDGPEFLDALRARWPSVPVLHAGSLLADGCSEEAPDEGARTREAPDAVVQDAEDPSTRSAPTDALATLGLARRFADRVRRLPSHRRDEMVGPESLHR